MKKTFALLCLLVLFFSQAFAQRAKTNLMTNQRLHEVLKADVKILEHEPGLWRVQYQDLVLMIITDSSHNRMRIISPIVEVEKLSPEMYPDILEAQFDRALDVKYAIFRDVVWSVFIHPLGELSPHQVRDAMTQVYNAAYNFGGSYTSTDLIYGGSEDPE